MGKLCRYHQKDADQWTYFRDHKPDDWNLRAYLAHQHPTGKAPKDVTAFWLRFIRGVSGCKDCPKSTWQRAKKLLRLYNDKVRKRFLLQQRNPCIILCCSCHLHVGTSPSGRGADRTSSYMLPRPMRWGSGTVRGLDALQADLDGLVWGPAWAGSFHAKSRRVGQHSIRVHEEMARRKRKCLQSCRPRERHGTPKFIRRGRHADGPAHGRI